MESISFSFRLFYTSINIITKDNKYCTDDGSYGIDGIHRIIILIRTQNFRLILTQLLNILSLFLNNNK